MTNSEFIKRFLTKETQKGVYCHLAIYNNELINYGTTIAYFKGKTLYVNVKKYSSSTTKIQNSIIAIANRIGMNYKEYEGEKCTYWNYGYCGAPTRTMADIREWERLDKRLEEYRKA